MRSWTNSEVNFFGYKFVITNIVLTNVEANIIILQQKGERNENQ
jgi:hypothetical protein